MHRVSHSWAPLTALLVVLFVFANVRPADTQTSLAKHAHFIVPTCLEGIPEIRIPPVRVGCEVIDCCPGCPGLGVIDWRIRVEGPIQQVSLRFENLAKSVAANQLTGSGRMAGDTVVMRSGETRLSGLTQAQRGQRPPLVQTHVMFDSAGVPWADAPVKQASRDGLARIIIEQYMRGALVNERVLVYWLRRCGRPLLPPPTDQIDLNNNAANDNAAVFLDARRSSGCVNDEIHRGFNLINVLSVLSNGTCRSEAVIFSDDDAVRLIENVSVWTDPLGNILPANLTPDRWQVPVDVWITRNVFQARSQNEMAQADLLLNTNHAGVDVLAGAAYRALPSAANVTLIDSVGLAVWNSLSCAATARVTGNAAIYTAGRPNVYFVNQAFTGWYCGGTNVIMIGTNAQPESLAHEFGHSFSLGHTNAVDYNGDGVNDFPNVNIMMGGGVGRTTFSEGQCFRMTLNPTSDLNRNGVRNVGPTRTCADGAISPTCPWIALDAVPN